MKLTREVVVPDGPNHHEAVGVYRRRRKAIDRARRERSRLYEIACGPRVFHDHLMQAVDEIDRLIKVLKEAL